MERHRDSGSQEAREAVSLPAPATTGPAGESPEKKKNRGFPENPSRLLYFTALCEFGPSKKQENLRFFASGVPGVL